MKSPRKTKTPNPKRKSIAEKVIETTGIGPFSGIRVGPGKTTVPKLSDPTKDVGKKLIRKHRVR